MKNAMSMKRLLLLAGIALCVSTTTNAQSNSFRDAFNNFSKGIRKEYDNFRQKIMKEYAEYVRQPWKEAEEEKPIPRPKEENVPPVVIPVDTVPAPIESKPVVIEEVVEPVVTPEPQPEPVAPVEEHPVEQVKYLTFNYFGTPMKVRFDEADKLRLMGIKPDDIAQAMVKLSSETYDNLIYDCLELRKTHKLGDWAYLQMLKALAETLHGKDTNEAELLMAYIYIQSGYKMRLAQDGQHLYMLFSSKHQIFDLPYFTLDDDRYYPMRKMPSSIHICAAMFPKEQSLSLYINQSMELEENKSAARTVTSRDYPDFKATVEVNKNLLDFYSTYPTSVFGDDVCTRWAMYANTPMQKKIADSLYPQLKAMLQGKGKLESVEMLLNWVQTGLEYEYDDRVWGGDRAFFAEETLYYPYCDCEDRSILFTRLVRDLLGLPCILVYYPGHLAAAVQFPEQVKGDYIVLNGKQFVVTDPTYIGAPVGRTMPKMDNASAKVILLQ